MHHGEMGKRHNSRQKLIDFGKDPDTEAETIQTIFQRYPTGPYFRKLAAIFLLLRGVPEEEVARAFSVTTETLEHWMFLQCGPQISGQHKLTMTPGSPTTLSAFELEEVLQAVQAGLVTTGTGLQEHIKDKFEKDLSVRQCQRVLKKFKQPILVWRKAT